MRLYEELGFIARPARLPSGYRVFTKLHLDQFRLARTAFATEVLQNGLRKKITSVVKAAAGCDFQEAIRLAGDYLMQLERERQGACEATQIAARMLKGSPEDSRRQLGRKAVSEELGIPMDALRNWERNGLLHIKRKQNGYRVYTGEDLHRLRIIRALRCGGYSLEAILRMLSSLKTHPETDIEHALNTPRDTEDIVAVCDRLIASLDEARSNALRLLGMLAEMKEAYP